MATQPKLAMIPSGYKDGKLYSALPTDGAGDFDITRGSDATRINKDGLIEAVTGNTPRLDYTGGGCPSLLLEPQRTNLILNSQRISLAPAKSGTYTDDFAISPDGTQNSTKLTATNTDPYFYQSTSLSAGVHTESIYIKGIGSSIGKNFQIRLGSNIYTDVIPLEWTRFQYTATVPSGATSIGLEIPNPAVTGDEVLVWGWQLEEQSYATSYIPTSGSAQTRLADTANGAGDASTFNDSEGVLMAEISALANGSITRRLSISNGTSSNRLVLSYNSTSNEIQSFLANPAVQFNFYHTLSNSIDFNKIVVKYKQNDFALWVNGFEVATDTSGTVAVGLDRLNFNEGSGAAPFYGNTKQIQYYNTALTDLELEKITSYTSFNAMALAQNYTI